MQDIRHRPTPRETYSIEPNDGDVDDSDEYLHKRRKTVSKAIAQESVSLKDTIRNMWIEAAKKEENDDEEDKDEKEEKKNGKTMTEKPMSNIEVNHKDESNGLDWTTVIKERSSHIYS